MNSKAKNALRTITNCMIANLRALLAHALKEGADDEALCYEEAIRQLKLAIKHLDSEDTHED